MKCALCHRRLSKPAACIFGGRPIGPVRARRAGLLTPDGRNDTRVTAFQRLTGWGKPSNQHTRDAALVAWPYRSARCQAGREGG